MELSIALAEDPIRAELRRVAADVETSLALARVTLRALATLSEQAAMSADLALDEELDLTGEPRVITALEQVRERLARAPEEDRLARQLEQALRAAAGRLTAQAA